jgi:dethiobiotin synthetase
MEVPLPARIFVTGTDTGVGKSIVAATLTIGLEADYWKPVQTGCASTTDSSWLRTLLQGRPARVHPEAYRFDPPLSPHAAAEMIGTTIALEKISLPEGEQPLIVEGAGGVLVPLNRKQTMLDLMRKLDLPVVLVARSSLGTINHTLLSVGQLRQAGLEPLGVVMNGPKNVSNCEAIEHYGRLPVLAEIEPLQTVDGEALGHLFRAQFAGK